MQQRPFPQAYEAERALLGGLIQRPDELSGVVQDEGLRPDDFHRPEHQSLFRLLVEMHARREAIDLITVPERIGRDGRQDEYGGIAYVLELGDHVPSTANLRHYAKVIKEKGLLRQLLETMGDLSDQALRQPEHIGTFLRGAVDRVRLIGEQSMSGSWSAISEVVDEEIVRIEQLGEQQGEVTGHTTGFIDLDKKLAGLQRSDLIILAARPAMGKTALALNLASNVALLAQQAVGIFSLEMSRGQLVTRMMCCEGLIDAGRVRTGNLEQDDWERLMDASERLSKVRIHIDDTPNLSISDLTGRAARLKNMHPDLGLIVIDYLQLMRGDDPRAPREQQISAISRGLKGMAKELDVPVIALSQLNRGVESRADKRPMVSDLRESGAIEQDADIIMFIYRDEYYNPESPDKGLAEVIIAKQRNGPTGTVKLVFQGQFTRFDNRYEGFSEEEQLLGS